MRARPLLLLSGLCTWVTAHSAHATANFPDAMQRDLGLSYSPPCAVCHSGGVTMRGTTNTPFGKALRAHGLAAYDETSLGAALGALQAAKTDSDGDMTDDIDELRNGTDPNVSEVPGLGIGSSDGGVGPPVYGCELGRPRCDSSGLAGCFLVLLLGRVRRRLDARRES
jgi:hypothetical protein